MKLSPLASPTHGSLSLPPLSLKVRARFSFFIDKFSPKKGSNSRVLSMQCRQGDTVDLTPDVGALRGKDGVFLLESLSD